MKRLIQSTIETSSCPDHPKMQLRFLTQDLKDLNIFKCSDCVNELQIDPKLLMYLDQLASKKSQPQIMKYYPFMTTCFSDRFKNLSNSQEENNSFISKDFQLAIKQILSSVEHFSEIAKQLIELLIKNQEGIQQSYFKSSNLQELIKILSSNDSIEQISQKTRDIIEQSQGQFLEDYRNELDAHLNASRCINQFSKQIKDECTKLSELIKIKQILLKNYFESNLKASKSDILKVFEIRINGDSKIDLPLQLTKTKLKQSQEISVLTSNKEAMFIIEDKKQVLVFLQNDFNMSKAFKLKVKFHFPNKDPSGRNVLILLQDLDMLLETYDCLGIEELCQGERSKFDFDANILVRGELISNKEYSKEEVSFEIRWHIGKGLFYVADEGNFNINKADETKYNKIKNRRLSFQVSQAIDAQTIVTITEFTEIDPNKVLIF